MQAVVLAGGLGTRLRPLTETLPKALVPVAGRPFIEYQIDLFRRWGVDDLIICAGHLGHLIQEHLGDGRRFGIAIRYGREQERLLGTAGAIKNVERLLDDKFFVQYGDSYLLVDYPSVMEHFRNHDQMGLMVVYANNDRWDPSNVVVKDGFVEAYDKRQKLPGMVYIDYGVSVLRREVVAALPALVATDLTALYQGLIAQHQLLAYEARHRFYEIGSPQGLREFEAFVQSGALAR